MSATRLTPDQQHVIDHARAIADGLARGVHLSTEWRHRYATVALKTADKLENGDPKAAVMLRALALKVAP